jgi:hypothetical protein
MLVKGDGRSWAANRTLPVEEQGLLEALVHCREDDLSPATVQAERSTTVQNPQSDLRRFSVQRKLIAHQCRSQLNVIPRDRLVRNFRPLRLHSGRGTERLLARKNLCREFVTQNLAPATNVST